MTSTSPIIAEPTERPQQIATDLLSPGQHIDRASVAGGWNLMGIVRSSQQKQRGWPEDAAGTIFQPLESCDRESREQVARLEKSDRSLFLK